MMTRYRLASGCRLGTKDADLVIDTGYGQVRISAPSASQRAVFEALAQGPVEHSDLEARVGDDEGGIAWLEMTLERLFDTGLVIRTIGDPILVDLAMIGRSADGGPVDIGPDAPVVLSRHAYLHLVDDRLVLESPRSALRMSLVHPGMAAVLSQLAGGSTRARLRALTLAEMGGIDRDALDHVVAQMASARLLEPMSSTAAPHPPGQALAEWSFHDLLFHARCRSGRHNAPYGAFYPWEGRRTALPAVRDRYPGELIELPQVDLDALLANDRPFTAVLEERQSWRRPGPEALTIAQLGEFLQRSSRVRGRRGTEHEEVSSRPYPGGGADYELEIYPVVHRVTGLESGLYHYDPLTHGLVLVRNGDRACDRLLEQVAQKLDSAAVPDVALLVTARIQRLTYKYESIPYSIALKDLGALYATWYLVATAMALAPCAVGGGDFDSLAALTGTSPYVEPHIGEFVLNTQDPLERRPPPPEGSIERARAAVAPSSRTADS